MTRIRTVADAEPYVWRSRISTEAGTIEAYQREQRVSAVDGGLSRRWSAYQLAIQEFE
ncbi:MAG: hypothetical protein AAGJ56_08715 [Myxococcota bacterium]